MDFYAETYGNLVNGTAPVKRAGIEWVNATINNSQKEPSFTGEQAAAVIARIEEKIRGLEVNLRRCSWGTTKHAQETAAGITKEISEYRRDIEQIKSQTVGEIPMSQQFTAGNGTVFYFVQGGVGYDFDNVMVILFVNGVYKSNRVGRDFSEAKNIAWENYCYFAKLDIQTGLPL